MTEPLISLHVHRKLAQNCWKLIKSLLEDPPEDEETNLACTNLIEIACDSAAEGERIASGQKPRGVL